MRVRQRYVVHELIADLSDDSKLLLSIAKYAGSESNEMRLSLLIGIGSSFLCFFLLGLPETILNFDLRSGKH